MRSVLLSERRLIPIIAQQDGWREMLPTRVRFSDRVQTFGDRRPHNNQPVRTNLTPGNSSWPPTLHKESRVSFIGYYSNIPSKLYSDDVMCPLYS